MHFRVFSLTFTMIFIVFALFNLVTGSTSLRANGSHGHVSTVNTTINAPLASGTHPSESDLYFTPFLRPRNPHKGGSRPAPKSSPPHHSDTSGDESDSSHSGSSESGQKGKGKGKDKAQSKKDKEAKEKHYSERHTTIIKQSFTDLVTIQETCSGKKYPQACYHYSSAIKHYPDVASSLYTCVDHEERQPGFATEKWKKEHHKGWRHFTRNDYDNPNDSKKNEPQCQIDEFPPAYFMPSDTKEKKLSQIVRYLPGHENGGAANTQWAGFCAKHDGGQGNGQLRDSGKINKKLVNADETGKKVHINKGHNGEDTTTVIYQKATISRAVFSMVFDEDWEVAPTDGNQWGLLKNPCWPEAIVPDNPGFVLQADDSYYQQMEKKGTNINRNQYKKPPSDELKAKAEKALKKRPHSPEDSGSSNKAPKNDPPSRRHHIQVLDDGFALVEGNVTRRLTPEEVKRDCSLHRRDML